MGNSRIITVGSYLTMIGAYMVGSAIMYFVNGNASHLVAGIIHPIMLSLAFWFASNDIGKV